MEQDYHFYVFKILIIDPKRIFFIFCSMKSRKCHEMNIGVCCREHMLNICLLTQQHDFILQNAAHTVRLDGDIICQQNEVPIWQAAEGPGSLEDIQSVCSCTALTCDPFHIKAKSRLKRSRRDTMETEEDLQGGLKFGKKQYWHYV